MRFMTVQTIPSIEEMTGAQRVELMEELWKAISKRPEDIEVPERHRRILEERREAVDRGEIDYIDWEEAKRQIRSQIK
jgi:2-oxoglutarate dehydrogenase complex dehydrogenase (E1) component-like enzyme